MAQKDTLAIFTGAVILVIVTSLLNLLLNFNIVLSILLGIIAGIIIGFVINNYLNKFIILGIIAWGLIIFAIFSFILKSLNIISSPPIIEILLGGMLAELLRIETKFKEFRIL